MSEPAETMEPGTSGDEEHTDEEGEAGNEDGKRVRVRITFEPWQLQTLEEAFHAERMPSAEKRKDLALRLKIPEQSVMNWFQNRRKKEYRASLLSGAPATSTVKRRRSKKQKGASKGEPSGAVPVWPGPGGQPMHAPWPGPMGPRGPGPLPYGGGGGYWWYPGPPHAMPQQPVPVPGAAAPSQSGAAPVVDASTATAAPESSEQGPATPSQQPQQQQQQQHHGGWAPHPHPCCSCGRQMHQAIEALATVIPGLGDNRDHQFVLDEAYNYISSVRRAVNRGTAPMPVPMVGGPWAWPPGQAAQGDTQATASGQTGIRPKPATASKAQSKKK